MLLYSLLFIGAQAVSLLEPWVVGQLLNVVQMDINKVSVNKMLAELGLYLSILFVIEVVFWLLHGPGRVIERIVAYNTKAAYKTHMFSLVSSLPLKWHRQHHSGESIDKINRATESLGEFLDQSFEVNYMLFRLIGSQIMLFCFMPFAGWVSVITTAVAFGVVYIFDRYLFGQYGVLNKNDNHVASALHDYVTNIETVITLRLERRTLNEVVLRIFKIMSLFKKNVSVHEVKWFITTILIISMTVIVLWYYVASTLAAGHNVLGGTFFTMWEYLRRIGQSFYDFSALYGELVKRSANVCSADSIAEAAAELSRPVHASTLPRDWKLMAVSDLNFRYEDEEHRAHHLDNAWINLERGKAIAVVGESGSGKSTLLRLLRGLHNADSVQVLCDGKELPHGLSDLAERTTLLPQDPQIFADTIRHNVSFGLEAGEEKITQAIELARFEKVLARLPRGLDTDIAEKGVNLSGGEKQRLALARGIFFARDCELILLDEPTSSVDTYNERIIYNNLLNCFRSQCLVSSIHKLHLLNLFDEIYVFDDGCVVENGTFQELLARNGQLAGMWHNYQSGAGACASSMTTLP
jgi:ABC-type multidrug transport system fused ATPase/permease subunit